MIKGVVFDFNGTLFFDTHLHNQAWDIFLDRHSLRFSDKEKNERIHGKNNQEILTNIFSRSLTPVDIERLSIEKEDIYQSLCLNSKIELAPGAVDFIEFLANHKIPYTIATASDLYNIEFYFKHLELGMYFDRSKIIYSDGKIKSKPNPEIFIKAMYAIGVAPCNTIVFEDSPSGITAAENARVQKVVIVDSARLDYTHWNHDIIKDFSEIDRQLFRT